MLKTTKIVGIATALTLMTGVALAPTASALVLVHPSLLTDETTSANAGDLVNWGVSDIRTGCSVTTTLGSKSATVTAVKTSDTSDAITLGAIGESVPKTIKAPTYAGEFVLKSQVESTCKDDAKFKMSEDVWVGSDAYFGGESDWTYDTVAGDSLAMDVTGYLVNFDEYDSYTGESITDVGDGVKVLFYNGRKLIASTGVADDGFVSVRLPGKSFKVAGSTTIRVALSHNAEHYIPAADDTISITVG
jgi:hypothetical protein